MARLLSESPMLPESIRTPRLLLRRARLGDAQALLESFCGDPEVTRFLLWRPHSDIAETLDYLRHSERGWEDASRPSWLILEASSGDLLGMVGGRFADIRFEPGFVLARRHWGRGYMGETLAEILKRALALRRVTRVEAFCHVDNLASRRVMEKLGMRCFGLFRGYDVFPNLGPEPADCLGFAKCRQLDVRDAALARTPWEMRGDDPRTSRRIGGMSGIGRASPRRDGI